VGKKRQQTWPSRRHQDPVKYTKIPEPKLQKFHDFYPNSGLGIEKNGIIVLFLSCFLCSGLSVPPLDVPDPHLSSALKSGCKTAKRPQTGPDQDCKRPDQQSSLLDFEILGPQKDWPYWTGCVGWDQPLVLL